MLEFDGLKRRVRASVTKTAFFQSPDGAVAVHRSEGAGPPIVLIHGNSCSARSFCRQLDGPLGQRRRLVAIDLAGHGRSENAGDPAAYRLPGLARTLAELAAALGLGEAGFVGWSLGGRIVLEASGRCRLQDLNPRPTVYKTAALPTELNRLAVAAQETVDG